MHRDRSEAEHVVSVRLVVGMHRTEGNVTHNLAGRACHKGNDQSSVIAHRFDQIRFQFTPECRHNYAPDSARVTVVFRANDEL
jgi:hypothetical protein